MNTPNLNNPYHWQARRLVEKLINSRFYLIKRGLSGAGQDADSIARELHMQLQAYPYATDIKMASFLVRYEECIRMIIPGVSSKCHKSFVEKFEQLLGEAKAILAHSNGR